MKQSPKESAKKYKIGTKKTGLGGNDYYVLTDKNKQKRWVKEGCLFVIYKINPTAENKYWYYKNFPSNWESIGSGTTVSSSMLSDNVKYPDEEQFMGNPKYTTKMRKILTTYFNGLKDKKIIKHYKIVSRKGLQDYIRKI